MQLSICSGVPWSVKYRVKRANAQKARQDLNDFERRPTCSRAERLKPLSNLSRQPHFFRDCRRWFEMAKIGRGPQRSAGYETTRQRRSCLARSLGSSSESSALASKSDAIILRRSASRRSSQSSDKRAHTRACRLKSIAISMAHLPVQIYLKTGGNRGPAKTQMPEPQRLRYQIPASQFRPGRMRAI